MRRPGHFLPTTTIIVAFAGLVVAALGGEWDLFMFFVVLLGLQIIALVNAVGSRVAVSLRPDLARWVTRRSERSGEPFDDVIDRSVASFQYGLYGSDPRDDN